MGDLARQIRRPSDGLLLPRKEENDAPIAGRWVEQTHLFRAVVARKGDMNATAGRADFFDLWVVHFPDGVGEGPSGVYYTFRRNGPLFSREFVFDVDSTDDFFALGVSFFHKSGHGDVVGNSGAVSGGGQGDGKVHPGVVLLAVVVHDGAAESVPSEHGEELQGVFLREEVGAFEGFAAGDEVVHFDAHPVVGDLPPAAGIIKNRRV